MTRDQAMYLKDIELDIFNKIELLGDDFYEEACADLLTYTAKLDALLGAE